jgi:hypothetical protein
MGVALDRSSKKPLQSILGNMQTQLRSDPVGHFLECHVQGVTKIQSIKNTKISQLSYTSFSMDINSIVCKDRKRRHRVSLHFLNILLHVFFFSLEFL